MEMDQFSKGSQNQILNKKKITQEELEKKDKSQEEAFNTEEGDLDLTCNLL
jgi:hypothetical protein